MSDQEKKKVDFWKD